MTETRSELAYEQISETLQNANTKTEEQRLTIELRNAQRMERTATSRDRRAKGKAKDNEYTQCTPTKKRQETQEA